MSITPSVVQDQQSSIKTEQQSKKRYRPMRVQESWLTQRGYLLIAGAAIPGVPDAVVVAPGSSYSLKQFELGLDAHIAIIRAEVGNARYNDNGPCDALTGLLIVPADPPFRIRLKSISDINLCPLAANTVIHVLLYRVD